MLRLNVIEKDIGEFESIVRSDAADAHELALIYEKKISEASESKTESLYFQAIPFVERKSTNFQNIWILEKKIMDMLRLCEYPKQVCIVCDSSDVAELYKVVYNFYYPGSKDERLADTKWD